MKSKHTAGAGVVVVVTTYNRPAALAWVLASLSRQTVMPQMIVIADDGSDAGTQDVIANWQAYFVQCGIDTKLIHVWQEDLGFRAAAARNLAVNRAADAGDLKVLVFLDGDCVVPPYFVENHLALLRRGMGVAGGRGLLSKKHTQRLEQMAVMLRPKELVSALKYFSSPLRLWLSGACDRYLSMHPFTNSLLSNLRDARPTDDAMLRTCNVSLWFEDFDRIGGFDESFVGWGLEDTEFAVRLISSGVRIRSGRFATNVFHLWHPERSRTELGANSLRLQASRNRNTQAVGD